MPKSLSRIWLGFAALYVALLPFERLWDNWLGSTTIFKPYRLVGMALLVLLVLRGLASRVAPVFDRYDRTLLALFAWGLGMAGLWHVINDVDLEPTVSEGTMILFALLTYAALKNTIVRRDQLATMLNTYVAAFAVAIAVALVLVPDPFVDRFRGLYKNPNQAGFVAGLAVLLFVGRFFFEGAVGPARRMCYAVAAIGFGAVLALSGSRGALIGTAVGLLTIMLTVRRASSVSVSRAQRFAIGAVVLVALAVVGPRAWTKMQAESAALDRLSPEASASYSGRGDIWRAAVAVALDHYLIGVGLAQYRNYHQAYTARLPNLYSPSVVHVRLGTHSDLFGLLANYGVVGLLLYLSLVIRLMRASWRATRYGATEHYIFPVLTAVWMLTLACEFFRDSFVSPEFFAVLALIMIGARRAAHGPGIARDAAAAA